MALEIKSAAAGEVNWWRDKSILLPKGLLLSDVCGEEIAVYAKMKSFGEDARSSIQALARRLDWSISKTRKWQKSVWQKKWLVLLTEGTGPTASVKKSVPRQWWMCSNAGEVPPQDVVDRVCKNGTLPPQGYDFEAPLKPSPKTDKSLQSNKKTISSDAPQQPEKPRKASNPLHIQAAGLLETFKGCWEQQFKGQKYIKGPGDFKQCLGLAEQGVTSEDLQLRARRWLITADEYTRGKNCPFWLFIRAYNSIRPEPIRPAAAGPSMPLL